MILFAERSSMAATIITDTNNGIITRVTVMHQDYQNYYWGVLAILAFALFAWVLRKIFWQTDSN
jgi:hypothetical protein